MAERNRPVNGHDRDIGSGLGWQVFDASAATSLAAGGLGAPALTSGGNTEPAGIRYQFQIGIAEVFIVLAITAALFAVVVGIPWVLLEMIRAAPRRVDE